MTRGASRGQSLTEFALILPVLLLIFMGIFDFGRAIFAYNALANAAREGVRTAIVNQNVDHIRGRAAAQATIVGLPSGDPGGCPANGGPTTAAAGVCVGFRSPTPADLSAACSSIDIGCVAVVSTKTTFTPLTPIIGNVVGAIPITATSRQSIESKCPNATVLAADCPRQ